MGSRHFQSYVANINRMNLIELIEACQNERHERPFKASLIVNPFTGLPYGTAQN